MWEAFRILSSDRPVAFAEGPIPFTAIDRYAVRYGIDDLDAFDEFRVLVTGMDVAYLEFRAAQRKVKTTEKA